MTIKDAIAEIKRELKMRERVYPRQIQSGKLHRDRANKQYKSLEHALTLLEEKQPQSKQQSLFP